MKAAKTPNATPKTAITNSKSTIETVSELEVFKEGKDEVSDDQCKPSVTKTGGKRQAQQSIGAKSGVNAKNGTPKGVNAASD